MDSLSQLLTVLGAAAGISGLVWKLLQTKITTVREELRAEVRELRMYLLTPREVDNVRAIPGVSASVRDRFEAASDRQGRTERTVELAGVESKADHDAIITLLQKMGSLESGMKEILTLLKSKQSRSR